MARPLRIDHAGGWYHLTSRGNERRRIHRDDFDRSHFIELLEELVTRFRWRLYVYVLMDNHYHLMVETPEAVSKAIARGGKHREFQKAYASAQKHLTETEQ